MLTILWQTKTKVSFPLEDRRAGNEHHVIPQVTQAKYKGLYVVVARLA